MSSADAKVSIFVRIRIVNLLKLDCESGLVTTRANAVA
jgi:hypothetical protein